MPRPYRSIHQRLLEHADAAKAAIAILDELRGSEALERGELLAQGIAQIHRGDRRVAVRATRCLGDDLVDGAETEQILGRELERSGRLVSLAWIPVEDR